jgi:hypothetical protein
MLAIGMIFPFVSEVALRSPKSLAAFGTVQLYSEMALGIMPQPDALAMLIAEYMLLPCCFDIMHHFVN